MIKKGDIVKDKLTGKIHKVLDNNFKTQFKDFKYKIDSDYVCGIRYEYELELLEKNKDIFDLFNLMHKSDGTL